MVEGHEVGLTGDDVLDQEVDILVTCGRHFASFTQYEVVGSRVSVNAMLVLHVVVTHSSSGACGEGDALMSAPGAMCPLPALVEHRDTPPTPNIVGHPAPSPRSRTRALQDRFLSCSDSWPGVSFQLVVGYLMSLHTTTPPLSWLSRLAPSHSCPSSVFPTQPSGTSPALLNQ